MGNSCCFKNQKEFNETIVNDDGTLLRKCSEQEICFWQDMNKLKLVKISTVQKSQKRVEFNYSDLFVENFISFSQIIEYLITEQNFFYFVTCFEITIAIVDFIQVVFALKKKYGLNNQQFFMINFEKFFLMKEGSTYSKIVYLDDKLCDYYSCAEIIYNDDSNLLSSFSVIEENNKSVQMLLSNINTMKINYNSTTSINLNSYFYSKCNDRYQKLKENYTVENCDKFYTENIINFITRSLLKKVTISDQIIEHDFNNFKFVLRHTFKLFFQKKENINLQCLKNILTNFYLNNHEFGVFNKSVEDKISNDSTKYDNFLMEKIISFEQAGISINYGDCDIENDSVPKTFHKISFIFDNLFRKNSNSRKNSLNFINNYNQNTSLCLNCIRNILFTKCPDNKSHAMSVIDFEEELLKKYTFIDLFKFLQYFSSYFESYEKSQKVFEEKGNLIQIYKRNQHCINFELIEWDEYQNEIIKNEILNLDFYVKNNVKRKSLLDERDSILPSKKN